MVAKFIVCIGAFWLIACDSSVSGHLCGMQRKMITWSFPQHMEGNIRVTISLSKDNHTWEQVYDTGFKDLHTDYVQPEVDTCKPTYYIVRVEDEGGLKSREGGCIGQGCEMVKFPDE